MDLAAIFNFLADCNIFMFIISAILAFRAMPFKNRRLRFLFVYFLFTIASSITTYLTRSSGNNVYLMYFITPVYTVLFTLLLIPEKEEHRDNKVYYLLMAFGLFLNVYEAFFIEGGVTYYNSITNLYISLFLGILALKGLLKLRYDDTISNLATEPMFWIFTAVAIKTIGNIVTTGFYKKIQDQDSDLLLKMVFVSLIVNYIGIVLYWIGFIKEKNIQETEGI